METTMVARLHIRVGSQVHSMYLQCHHTNIGSSPNMDVIKFLALMLPVGI